MLKAGTRIALSFLVALVVTLAGRVLVLRYWHHADSAALASTIDGKIAALDLPKRTVELPTETARRVRAAIAHGDYGAAQKIFTDVLAGSRVQSWRFYPFSDFVKGIADFDDPAFATGLDAWVAKDGSDAAAHLIRAQYYLDVAWAKRGHAYSTETAAAKLEAFKAYIDKALVDCEAAVKLAPTDPYAFFLRLDILGGLGASQEMMDAFAEAIGRYPGYYPLYTKMLEVLQPKWGGSVPSMYAFVDRYAGSAGADSPLKLLDVSLYRYLLETAATSCYSGNQDKDKLATCVSSAMQKIVTPELEGAIPAAMKLYDHSDKYQFGLALEAILMKMLGWSGGETYSGAILELAADGLHSNTELKPDKPTTNNYVIDKLVAESWYRKGFYDNALQKAREALKDIDATTFPSEAEKDVAIAGILDQFAAVYDRRKQLADMIAYEEAALSLGDPPLEEQYICYGYYQLKSYDQAIRLCTQSVDHAADTMESRYWRGAAYRAKGDDAAALKDFVVVAASESDLRASAAIDMSMIYFGRNDNRGALDVLNRYAWLYDPAAVDRQSVAVAYNNRCYAYMELGEPRKALDDCTQSLKFGSIPDAYSKQLKLMKQLNST